jgi:hypothetical protein
MIKRVKSAYLSAIHAKPYVLTVQVFVQIAIAIPIGLLSFPAIRVRLTVRDPTPSFIFPSATVRLYTFSA